MPKGQHSKFFPGKLRIMLDQVDGLGLSHGASWVSEGRAFAIHDPDVFMNDIAPQFFDKQTHLRSFHRQLSIWGFTRLETGAGGRGVWFNKNFIRDKPELIKNIKRVPVKNPKPSMERPKNILPDYTNYKLPSAVSSEPGPPKGDSGTQPGQDAAAKAGLPQSLPGQIPPDYLAALSRMPAGVPQGYPASFNPALQGRYPPFMANYQPSMVASLSGLQGLVGAGPNVVPNTNDLGDVAQQLLACRNTAGAPGALGDGNNNLNSAILSMIMDSRRQQDAAAPPANTTNASGPAPGQDLRQDLLSAIARRNDLLQQQVPKTSP